MLILQEGMDNDDDDEEDAMDEDDNDKDAKEDGEVLVSFMFGKRIKWWRIWCPIGKLPSAQLIVTVTVWQHEKVVPII